MTNLDQRISEEKEKLEIFSQETEETFLRLSNEIRENFLDNLNRIVSDDLQKFQKDVKRSLAAAGLDFLTDQVGKTDGGAFGSAFSELFSSSANHLVRTGKINARTFANLAAKSFLDSFLPLNNNHRSLLNFSRSQKSNMIFQEINRGRRNS